jgi:hypothetical protein
VHVRREGEARGVMAEPPLNLDRVAPGGEHARRDRVPEGMEAGPLDASLRAPGAQYAQVQVMRIVRPSRKASEDQLGRLTPGDLGSEAVR